MNKKILYIVVLIGLIVVLASLYNANHKTEQTSDEKILISATVFPVYDMARNVVGDTARVELILSPGASPHTFDASPSVLAKLQGSKIIFAIGQGIDSWTSGIVDNVPGAKLVELDHGIDLRKSTEEHEEEEVHTEEEEHGEFDPHYWLDPKNAMIMVNTIVTELGKLDPENLQTYRHNADAFIAELEKNDIIWQERLSNISARDIITFHDAFFYFADHFGLNVVTTFEPFPGKEPTPAYLQKLQNEIEEHNITVLFTEPQLYGASLQQFARDNNIAVSVLDPLGGVSGRESYIKLIDYNVETIGQALK